VRNLTALILSLLLAACASSGANFRDDRLGQLQPGMTEQEVIGVLGAQPVSRTYTGDGSYIAMWQYIHVVYVSATDNKLVSLLFNKEHKFVRVVNTVNVNPSQSSNKSFKPNPLRGSA
jgi:outer membrane protein assembly factor BamE (lipoprotein component of BamABCDE complex)